MPCSCAPMPAPAREPCCRAPPAPAAPAPPAAPPAPCCRGCRCRARRASPLTCAAVCFLVLSYNLLGGFLFLALEGAALAPDSAVAASQPALGAGTARPPAGASDALRAETVERLWAITEDLNILYRENWTALAARELLRFQRVLLQSGGAGEAGAAGGAGRGERARGPDQRWTFSGSFLYALTLITTIGPGSVTPRSAAGKLVSVAYASVGIPLVTLYLATLGGALAPRLRAAAARLGAACRMRPARRRTANDAEPLKLTPFQAALNQDAVGRHAARPARPTRGAAALGAVLLVVYVALGAALFRATERWSLADAAYFSFCSLATVGFGELRPGRAGADDAAAAACCAYILAGAALVAACFELLRDDCGALLRSAASLCAGGARPRVHEAPPTRAAPAS